jgi:hypothetical protein
MALNDILVKEQTLIDFYKAESVRNFERNLTSEFNNAVNALRREIAQLKESLAVTEATIFLN